MLYVVSAFNTECICSNDLFALLIAVEYYSFLTLASAFTAKYVQTICFKLVYDSMQMVDYIAKPLSMGT